MPTCYVTTPFGRKTSSDTGRVIDHDDVYFNAIKPAAQAAGCDVIRADEYLGGGVVHKSMLGLGMGADVFIADLGAGNANVMYEVGVRHAARRGVAILVAPAEHRIPFNISYSRIFTYQADDGGRLSEAEAFRLRDVLRSVIEQGLRDERNDSPVFEFFPGYSVELPEELRPNESRRRIYSQELKQALVRAESPSRRKENARTAEEIVKSTAQDDPAATIEVLKKYRELGAWDDLIRFTDGLPPRVKDVSHIQQMLALALNRRNQTGDRDRAVALMEQLAARTGGDAETHGILGSIYKDRFAITNDPHDIQQAIAQYRAGFEKEPSDAYPGVNLVHLLVVYGGEAGRQEAADLVPRVRRALEARMDPDRIDYWDLATALELAIIAQDASFALEAARRIAGSASDRWMLEATLANLAQLEPALAGDGLACLRAVEDILRQAMPMPPQSEQRHA